MNAKQSRHDLSVIVVLTSLAILFQGCASAPARNNPLPESLADQALVPGLSFDERSFADEAPKNVEIWLNAPEDAIRAEFEGIMDREHVYLAISGGGDNGAFGAGLLNGWSESGTRPEFTIVTGISAGGLIAPFAFLGPAYDKKLEQMFTLYSTEDLLAKRHVWNIIRNDAVADSAPLRGLIAKYVDEAMMREIAEQSRLGRMLLIGTTNLDAGRPVMWNIGRIAESGEPGALDLIHDVMLASASIPGAFPPVPIEVEVDGTRYEELHVDGGVTSQVFLYPLGLDWRRVEKQLNVQGKPKLYVIRNAFLDPDWMTVERKIAPILGRTVSSLIRTQGIGDLLRLYFGSVRDGLKFHLASIPEDVEYNVTEPFDREYMNGLYQRARAMAVDGFPWVADPYGLEAASDKWRVDQ
jgi:hypothetical protein